MASILALLIWLGRAELRKTLVSRRLTAALVFTFAAQAVIAIGGWAVGTPPLLVQLHMIASYFVISMMAAINVDKRITPSALGFGVAYIVGSLYPQYWMYVKSASSFVFTINIVWAWRLLGYRHGKTA